MVGESEHHDVKGGIGKDVRKQTESVPRVDVSKSAGLGPPRWHAPRLGLEMQIVQE